MLIHTVNLLVFQKVGLLHTHQGSYVLRSFCWMLRLVNLSHFYCKFVFPDLLGLFSFGFRSAAIQNSGREWLPTGGQAWWAILLIFASVGSLASPSAESSNFQSSRPRSLPVMAHPLLRRGHRGQQRKGNLLFCSCGYLVSIGSQG